MLLRIITNKWRSINLSKNNKKEVERRLLETKQHFGFKKVSKGVASALLGLSLAYGIGTVTASAVEASELEPGVGVNGSEDTVPVVDKGVSEMVSPVVADVSEELSEITSGGGLR